MCGKSTEVQEESVSMSKPQSRRKSGSRVLKRLGVICDATEIVFRLATIIFCVILISCEVCVIANANDFSVIDKVCATFAPVLCWAVVLLGVSGVFWLVAGLVACVYLPVEKDC